MSNLAEKLAGKFIVLDGPDGSGKSTQLAMLTEHLGGLGAQVECVCDPGTTAVGEKIRAILLDRENGTISPMCETMLFMASRAQLIAERVRPALEAGKAVLCDRFISATVAYQGASGVDPKAILKLGKLAVQGAWPDLTIILDVPVEVGMRRIGVPRERLKKAREPSARQRPLFGDRLEVKDLRYHEAVRQKFLELPKDYGHRVVVIKADEEKDAQAVFRDVLAELEKALSDQGS